MHMHSTRFGAMEIREDAVLTFPDGIPGLPAGTRWAFVAANDETPFFWLHSIDHPDVAVPVTSPWLFFGDYEVRISEDDALRLGLTGAGDAYIVCIIRAAESLADFTINLASPVIVNAAVRLGRQVINGTGGYAVRHLLFSEVALNEVEPHRSPLAVTAAPL